MKATSSAGCTRWQLQCTEGLLQQRTHAHTPCSAHRQKPSQVGDPRSGRISYASVDAYLAARHATFDRRLLAAMFQEADYKGQGSLAPRDFIATVAGALGGLSFAPCRQPFVACIYNMACLQGGACNCCEAGRNKLIFCTPPLQAATPSGASRRSGVRCVLCCWACPRSSCWTSTVSRCPRRSARCTAR